MNQIGQYEIESPLGPLGGTSRVYRAVDAMKRTVALKVLLDHLAASPEYIRRFQREAENVANLRHENIVIVHHASLYEPPYYMAFEFLSRGTLVDRISRPMTVERTLEIIEPICKAIDHAHRQKVIHRDIKPGNIMFDDTDRPKLTDFGIALADNQTRLTMVGVKFGTAEYMSPEQADGKEDLDWRTDIYSLAAVVYHMVTGRPPFPHPDPLQVLRKIINDPVTPPSRVNAGLPRSVDRVILKAMNKKRERRYQSAMEFCRALAAAAEAPPASDETNRRTGKGRGGKVRPKNERGARPQTAVLMALLVVVALGIGLVLRAMVTPRTEAAPPPPLDAVVPPVSAQYWPDAANALRKWKPGLRVLRKTQRSLAKQKSHFIRTEPRAGEPAGDTVTVVIGHGPPVDERYHEQLHAAEATLSRGDYQDAITLTKALIAAYGEDPTLLSTQAVSHYRLGELTSARAAAELAVLCDSDCAESWGTLAVIAFMGGDTKRAEEAASAVYNCSVSRQTRAARSAANGVKDRLAEMRGGQ